MIYQRNKQVLLKNALDAGVQMLSNNLIEELFKCETRTYNLSGTSLVLTIPLASVSGIVQSYIYSTGETKTVIFDGTRVVSFKHKPIEALQAM